MTCDGGGSALFRCSDRSGTGAGSNTTVSVRLLAVKHRQMTAMERKVLRLVVADLRLMRLRTADVAANVCIRDERGAVVDPKRPSSLLGSRRSTNRTVRRRSGLGSSRVRTSAALGALDVRRREEQNASRRVVVRRLGPNGWSRDEPRESRQGILRFCFRAYESSAY